MYFKPSKENFIEEVYSYPLEINFQQKPEISGSILARPSPTLVQSNYCTKGYVHLLARVASTNLN